jgi:hypothetical protein
MKRALDLLLALTFAVSGPAFAAGDAASRNLLDAKTAAAIARGASLLDSVSAGAAVFDGAKPGPSAGAGVVSGTTRGPKASLNPPAAATAPAVPAAPAPPTPAHGISDGYIGLYPEGDFELGTGRCETCRAPREGKWYFLDDVIATPKTAAGTPALVWIGSTEMVEGATLSKDGTSVTLKDGTVMPFALTPKIDSNRSFYDTSSLAFYRNRTVRIRGEYAVIGGVKTLVARTIWPEDFRLDPASIQKGDATNSKDIDALVAADGGGAKSPFETKLLWEKPGQGRDWTSKPVMGFMLNGAQGDDDEALAGHFSLFTGRTGPNGSMADWMFDNFYDMNTVSEKGIVASMVPMDKYMADLNSGQSWYRPTDMLVMIMKDDRVPLQTQELFKKRYAEYYAQDFKYDHTHMNCTALIADPVRSEGWNYPEDGKTPVLVAKALAAIVGLKDKKAAQEMYDSMREEPTRSFPRASFDSVGGDMLNLAGVADDSKRTDGGPDPVAPDRKLTSFEKMIREDLIAIVFVRIPQIPSSRKFGRDPAGSVIDYFWRIPGGPKQTVPSSSRPFPPPH